MNGLLVGFTSSLPLLLIVGPVSLMVLDTGLTTGVRGGWPAPLGVAGVDLAYASATAAAGLGLQRLLNEHQEALGWGGGLALMILAAGFGAFVAARQSWLQRYPPEVVSCGRDLYGMIETFPLKRAIPMIFKGGGDCTAVDFRQYAWLFEYNRQACTKNISYTKCRW